LDLSFFHQSTIVTDSEESIAIVAFAAIVIFVAIVVFSAIVVFVAIVDCVVCVAALGLSSDEVARTCGRPVEK